MDLVEFLKIMEMEERAAYAKYQWAIESDRRRRFEGDF